MRSSPTVRFLAIILVVALAACGCQSKTESVPQGPPIEISLAVTSGPYSGLIAVAEGKGFFRESGLAVSIKNYPSGLSSVEALSQGQVQMATAADFVFARKMHDDPSLRVVASIGLVNTNEIVARRDRDIRGPSDLKGKRIGFSLNTTSEYYLGTFLLLTGISLSEVTAINIPSDKIIDALESGEVDAISSWDTYVYGAKKRMGDNAISWPAQNNIDYQWLLIAREELTRSPESIKRFLKALVKAQDFLLTREGEAKNVIMRRYDLEPEFMAQVWNMTRLNVSLNQSLVDSLEAFTMWKMRKEDKSGSVPNFLDYIYTDALGEIAPKAVTIFK